MKKTYHMVFLAAALLFFAMSISAKAKPKDVAPLPSSPGLALSFALPQFEENYWGLASVSLSGGRTLIALLKRGELELGTVEEKKFNKQMVCDWDDAAAGAKVFAEDVDADGSDEIIVTGTDDGSPASFLFKVETDKCSQMTKQLDWSLRAFTGGTLGAQWWSSQDYFTGPVVLAAIADGKIKKKDAISLPPRTRIYQYANLPDRNDAAEVLTSRGRDHLELFSKGGTKFKRIWRSGEKFGGTVNILPARSRDLLDEAKAEYVQFEVTPQAIVLGGNTYIIAIRQDMPVSTAIGTRPYIKSSEIVIFRRDDAFGMVEAARSPKLSGPVADFTVDKKATNVAEIRAIVQEGQGYFEKSTGSKLFSFQFTAN